MGQPNGEEIARIKAIQDNAERLGLTWAMRPATVTSADPVEAISDGDTEAIGMISMIGAVTKGQRVYVMRVPPAANYIAGTVDASTPEVGTVVGWISSVTNGGATGGEFPILTSGSVTFKAGCAYEIDYEADTFGSSAGNVANFQIRRTSAAGTVLRQNSGHTMSSVAGFGITCKGSAIVAATSADISDILLLTLSSPMVGTVQYVASANRLAFMRTTYIGPAANFPNATILA